MTTILKCKLDFSSEITNQKLFWKIDLSSKKLGILRDETIGEKLLYLPNAYDDIQYKSFCSLLLLVEKFNF